MDFTLKSLPNSLFPKKQGVPIHQKGYGRVSVDICLQEGRLDGKRALPLGQTFDPLDLDLQPLLQDREPRVREGRPRVQRPARR